MKRSCWCYFVAIFGSVFLREIRASKVDGTSYADPPSNDTNADTDWDSSTLIFTQVLFRGGVHAFETNNVFPRLENPFVERRGTLTKLGKQQSYQLGIYLRQRYGQMFNYTYDPYLVRLWSGKSNHTLEATQCMAAGLFPPVADHDHWHPNISWVPVPYHIDLKISLAGCFLAIYLPICKSLTYVINTVEFKQFGEENEEIIKYLCREAGVEDNTEAFEAFKVASSLQILSYYPEIVPGWANQTVLKQVEAYYYGFLQMISSFYPVQRISAGDVPERWPAFGSMLSVELHKKNGKEYVQLWYWYDVQYPPYRLKVSNCTTDPCTFAEFADLSRHNPGKLWEAECMGELTPSYRGHPFAATETHSSHLGLDDYRPSSVCVNVRAVLVLCSLVAESYPCQYGIKRA